MLLSKIYTAVKSYHRINIAILPLSLILILLVCLDIPLVAQGTPPSRKLSFAVIKGVRPVSYINESGEPDGFYPSLFKEIARINNWDVSYHFYDWANGLRAVQEGRTDIMPAVAKTTEREKSLDFSKVPAMVSWGAVAVSDTSRIASLHDLEGKTVAVMRGDQNGENFKHLIDSFGIECVFVEVSRHEDIPPMLIDKRADAGVFFGSYDISPYNIKFTSIAFNPVKSYFATAKGRNADILQVLDQQITEWQKDKDSFYYNALKQKIGSEVIEKKVIPLWTFYLAGGIAALLIASVAWSRSLMAVVNRRTEELSKSERRYADLLMNSPVATAVITASGKIQILNNRFVENFGYTLKDIPTIEEWFIVAYPDESERQSAASRWGKAIRIHDETGYFYPLEASVTCKDGTKKTIRFNYKVEGEVYITTFVDLTELRKAEQALQESEKDFRTVAYYTYDWEYWSLPDGSMKYVSPSCERVTGYTAKEFLENKNLLDKIIHPEDKNLWNKHINDNPEQCDLIEFRIFTKDGGTRWIGHSCQSVYGDNGEFLGKRVSNRDFTQIKSIYDQLRQAQKMEAIGTLSGGIAHDFNNILAAIIGYADLASRKTNDHTIEPDLNQILIAAGRAKELVRQILLFSRRGEERRAPINIHAVVNEALQLIRKTIPSTIALESNLDPKTGKIWGDATQIHQLIMNLCTNAYHAISKPRGAIKIDLFSTKVGQKGLGKKLGLSPGEYALLAITDTGDGIPEEVLPRIWDPFYTTKEKGRGTGLGLSVVMGIIQKHGGAVDVESTPGEGTTFKALIPITEKTADYIAEEPVSNTDLHGTENILWVDDEHVLAQLGKESLGLLGYKVSTATSASKALGMIQDNPDEYDLVVTDQTMPEMTGDMLAKDIHAIAPRIPIIIYTGHSSVLDTAKVTQIGVKEILTKPVEIEKLAVAVRRALN